ncbi:Neutral alpha-glucosidase AB [Diplonema papillatum]|nr:Neutral alpha-glucosidase AB [Diplonema papillatum]
MRPAHAARFGLFAVKGLTRYPGRTFAVLGLLYALFFILHAKLVSLPHEQTHIHSEAERQEQAEEDARHTATHQRRRRPPPNNNNNNDATGLRPRKEPDSPPPVASLEQRKQAGGRHQRRDAAADGHETKGRAQDPVTSDDAAAVRREEARPIPPAKNPEDDARYTLSHQFAGEPFHVSVLHYGNGIFRFQVAAAWTNATGPAHAQCRGDTQVVVPRAVELQSDFEKAPAHANAKVNPQEGEEAGLVDRLRVWSGGSKDKAVSVTIEDGALVVASDSVTVEVPAPTAQGNRGLGSMTVQMRHGRGLTGLPERTNGLKLRPGNYPLFNRDIQYELNNTLSLYGIVPILVSTSETRAAGFLWLNPMQASVDILPSVPGLADGTEDTTSVWTPSSQTGCLDFVVYPGGRTADVLRQHAVVTGRPFLPPIFSLGYHQCRWNYVSADDVLAVSRSFLENDMPCDAIWLDIEHTDRKRYFTWDPAGFSDPITMQEHLNSDGRKLVAITDPHISRAKGYWVHEQAEAKGLYVKDAAGRKDYEGHCWPGSSSWLDFLNPEVRQWYAGLFSFEKYKGSTESLFAWIDMNEPSVFSGPMTTMHPDALHFDGTKHGEVHNIYGHLQALATFDGLRQRVRPPGHDWATEETSGRHGHFARPFVLTRSFFAGTQRYAAAWTGDNKATWEYLRASVHMLLGMSMGGIPFVGADVGGFFNNAGPELHTRWFQLGVFYPFFRGHGHHDTKRKEPYLLAAPHKDIVRAALHLRYALLPHLYTAMFNASVEGIPAMRPLHLMCPEESPERFDGFFFGDGLLTFPIVTEGAREVTIAFPGSPAHPQTWYDFMSHERFEGGTQHVVPVQIATIPLYQEAGTIVATRTYGDDTVRSTEDLRRQPFQLRIALDPATKTACGKLYLDDEVTENYRSGAWSYRSICFEAGTLRVGPLDTAAGQHALAAFPARDLRFTAAPAALTSVVLIGWPLAIRESLESRDVTDDVRLITGFDQSLLDDWELQF